jgi:hypothetical protein
MADFNEDVNVNGQVLVARPWSDWIFLRQLRNVDGNGGFHITTRGGTPGRRRAPPTGTASRSGTGRRAARISGACS